jgi:ubiquinone/menaquinone biosynthesis C-methylase UbiE
VFSAASVAAGDDGLFSSRVDLMPSRADMRDLAPADASPAGAPSLSRRAQVRAYWTHHIHDLELSKHPVGSSGFFADLEEYRFDKLRYLDALIRSTAPAGKKVLEVGCGTGIDLARFAALGAEVTGVDFSPKAIDLARAHFRQRGLPGALEVMDATALAFPDRTFDLAYAHGVLQYASDPAAIVREMHRVLKPGGLAVLQVYNARSWLRLTSRLTGVPLEHEGAPVFTLYTAAEFRRLLRPFRRVDLSYERFPVKTRLHRGVKAFLYNQVFVGAFNALPRAVVRRLGWHLIAKALA